MYDTEQVSSYQWGIDDISQVFSKDRKVLNISNLKKIYTVSLLFF